MRDELPAIAKHAMRVLAAIEEAVTRFPRRHRYAAGVDLRNAARHVARCVHTAWRERQQQLVRVQELSQAVDDLKLEMMLADAVKAFGSIAELEAIGRLVRDLGRQVGGWLKALQSKGQNGSAHRPPVQRSQILSSRSTPQGVTP
jgi:hypothetical protein